MNKNDICLKNLGFKVTQPRLKILQLFEDNSNKHLTPDEVYESLKDEGVGIATVYRVINQFESVGLISRLKLDSVQVRYELNDGNHHDHIICVKCNKIQEFYNEYIERMQKKIVEEMGAKIIDHSLNIYVECKQCRGQ